MVVFDKMRWSFSYIYHSTENVFDIIIVIGKVIVIF